MTGKTSLNQVLRSFLDYFQEMELSHLDPDDSRDRYLQEFHSLKNLTERLKRDTHYSTSEGLKDVNRKKNRYKDILPYDRTRVVLSEYLGVPGSDYVNANYVRGSTGSQVAYIASQGPLPNTLVDFWRMIWECETTVIVMACNESESGKYKCESYWPNSVDDEEQQYGNMSVKLVKWKAVCPDFLVRIFEVRNEDTSRTVIQFHYSTWPDHGVPLTVTPILHLVRLMRDVQATETRPILVHCSAGCGRTGTICSIDYVWNLLRAGKLDETFSLYNIILEMRKQRIAMVQTLEQYILCYKAVAALFQQQLKIIDAHIYENLDEVGEPLTLRGGIRAATTTTTTICLDSSGEGKESTSQVSSSSPSSSLPSSSSSPPSLSSASSTVSANDFPVFPAMTNNKNHNNSSCSSVVADASVNDDSNVLVNSRCQTTVKTLVSFNWKPTAKTKTKTTSTVSSFNAGHSDNISSNKITEGGGRVDNDDSSNDLNSNHDRRTARIRIEKINCRPVVVENNNSRHPHHQQQQEQVMKTTNTTTATNTSRPPPHFVQWTLV